MESRQVIIENGKVINIVMHDDTSSWVPPEGTILLQSETANIGDAWDGTNFTTPPAPELTAEQKRADIIMQLMVLDQKMIRPNSAIMAAIAAGQIPDAADVAVLNDLISQATTLRGQL